MSNVIPLASLEPDHAELAADTYELFNAYVQAGFSRSEALELVKAVITSGPREVN